MRKCACDMRGFLSFLILWFLRKKPMSGVEIAREIELRKGCRPNAGTIYPALKELLQKKAIEATAKRGREKVYALTPSGRKQLEDAVAAFKRVFCDVFRE